MAVTLGLMGDVEEARKYADRVRELNPSFEANVRAEAAKWMWGDDKVIELWVDGLRKAGMDIADKPVASD